VLAGACGGGDGDGATGASTVADADLTTSATNGASAGGTTTDGEGDGDFAVVVLGTEIWMTLPDGLDEADVCSPADPAVAVVTVPALDAVQSAEILLRRAGGDPTSIDMRVDDDGVWHGVIGPFTAPRQAEDRIVDVRFVAHRLDGSTLTTDGNLTVRAPERCGPGVADRRNRRATGPELRVRTDPADATLAARGTADCSGLPGSVRLAATTGGGTVAVDATLTLPNGSTIGRALTRQSSTSDAWQTTLAVDAWASMPASTGVPVTVTAVTARGVVLTDTTTLTVHRPVPCDEADNGTAAGGVRLTVGATDVDATADGACPARATTVAVEVAASADTTSAEVRTRAPNGTITTWPVTRVSDRRWTATIGPIAATGTMADTNTLEVEARVRFDDATEATSTATLTVHRPAPCPTTTPATTIGAPQVDASVSPSDVDAAAGNSCPTRPTTYTVKARTNGQVTTVTARVQLPGGQTQTLTLSPQGGGQWAASGGPISGSGTMPETAAVTITVRAEGPGGTATDTSSFTLHRPASC